MVESMTAFKVLVNNMLMKLMAVYINFILFVKEEMTIFSVRSVGNSTENSEEPTLDTNTDLMKIEVNSLNAEALRFNPSTGWLMVGMVDAGGNMFGCSENSSGFGHSDGGGFGHSDCHGLNSQV